MGKVPLVIFLLSCWLSSVRTTNPEGDTNDDEYLDKLIEEFKEHQTLIHSAKENGTKEDDEMTPLNARVKYRKREGCNCTKFFMCDVGRSIEEESEEESGADLDVINIRLNSPTGGCPHYLDICCEKLKENEISKIKRPKPVCGKRNENGIGFRIVGGKDGEAQFGEFPWMAAILEVKEDDTSDGRKVTKAFVCGASLIHPRVLLTTAHCIQSKSASSLKARMGEWDTQTTSEIYPYEELGVAQIILHPNFVMRKTLANDIALLVLQSEVEVAPHISPICLPPQGLTLDSVECIATGWGKDEFGALGSYQTILKRVDLPVVSRNECQERLRQTRLGNKFVLHNSFLCAGGIPGKDTCKGDGGSPLVCKIPGSDLYFQYGIVSWGIGCGGSVPAVYVNVPHFSSWIQETLDNLGKNNFTESSSK